MNINEFIQDIEKYYGLYVNDYVKGSVVSYLKKDHKEDKLLEISRAIKYFHDARHGAPCISSIERALKTARYEKGQTDTHKTKSVKPELYDYSKDPECEKGTKKVDLTGMLKGVIKHG